MNNLTEQQKTRLTNELYKRIEVAAQTNAELHSWLHFYLDQCKKETISTERKKKIVSGIIKHVFDPVSTLESRYIFEVPISEYMAQCIAMKYEDVIKGYIANYDASDYLYHVMGVETSKDVEVVPPNGKIGKNNLPENSVD